MSGTKWVRHGGLGAKDQYSCSPKCGVRLNDSGACDLVACEPISDERKAADRGLVAPYLLEIHRETAVP